MTAQRLVVVGESAGSSDGEAVAPSLVQRRQALGKNNSPRRRTYRPCPRLPGRRIRLQSLSDPSKVCLMRCKGWLCAGCGPWMKDRFVKVASAEARRVFGKRVRFLTLTLGPEARALETKDRFKLMSAAWGKFTKRVERLPTHKKRNGDPVFKKLSAIWVREVHQDGTPHLHVLIDRYLDQKWVSKNWVACGGGPIVDIRQVNVGRIVAYVTKYLAKSLGQKLEGRMSDGLKSIRRYGATGKAKLKGIYPVKNGTEPWAIFWKPGVKIVRNWEQAGPYEGGLVIAWVMSNFGDGRKLDPLAMRRIVESLRSRRERLRASQARQQHIVEVEMSELRIDELRTYWDNRKESGY